MVLNIIPDILKAKRVSHTCTTYAYRVFNAFKVKTIYHIYAYSLCLLFT